MERGQRRPHVLRAFIAIVVLLANFPAAGLIVVAVASIHSRYVVTVINAGANPIDEIVVSGGGVEIEFGSVAPGATAERWFHIRADGELVFHARRDGEEIQGCIEGYVTPGMGEEMRLTIAPDGSFTVVDQRIQRTAVAE